MCIAADEMNRLRNCVAFNLNAKPTRSRGNEWGRYHWFADGSRLAIYRNGSASWWTPQYGEQKWHNWHHCNT